MKEINLKNKNKLEYEIRLLKTSVSDQKNLVELYKNKFQLSEREIEENKNLQCPLHTVVRNSVFHGRDQLRLPFLHKEQAPAYEHQSLKMKNNHESVPNPCSNAISRSTVQFDLEPVFDKSKLNSRS